MNKLIRYFDLASEVRPVLPQPVGKKKSEFHVIPQYIALFLGIIAQKFLQQYLAKGTWDPTGFWGWVLAACILAIIIFPQVYKGSFDPKKSIFVQLCMIFASGMGWQSLTTTMFKVTGAIN